ncbi:hypothetical protein N0V84_011132 [Fusarium piperis]|uniref:Nephrocystin 3-like N-terminal domain-containing protein n=1 Tax=Fusarium piperis TaxID=1435070 RepID=A0A9W8W3Q6_9HYPO|nr:hypothetical protein N0V84_011132 [Fusarium piperis]
MQKSSESSEALQPGSKGAADGKKTVRFNVPEEEESLTDQNSPTTPRMEMKSTKHKMMTDHIAGHLQFLALLTPRLSTKNLADGEDTEFASSQAPSGNSNPGERSTLGDEFEPEGQETPSIDIQESHGDMSPVRVSEDAVAPQDEEIPQTEPMDWARFLPPDPSHGEEDKITKHMREVGEHKREAGTLLKEAADRFAEADLPREADEAVQTMTRLLPQRDPYVDFNSGVGFEKDLTRESLYDFFNASLSSIDQGVYALLANHCTDEVWEVRSYQDPDEPTGHVLYSRRALFGLLLSCKRSLDILRCIVAGLSDFDVPLSPDTLRTLFPAWDDQVLDAFLQSQSTYDPWGRSNRDPPAPRPLPQVLASPFPPPFQVQGSYNPWVSMSSSGSPVPWLEPPSGSIPALQAQNSYGPWGTPDIGSPVPCPISLPGSISDSRSLVPMVDNASQTPDQGSQDDMDRQLMQHLYATDLSVVKEHIEGAAGCLPREMYAWIFEDANFQRFLHRPRPQLLWIHGDAALCRTMLLCGIIDELCEIPGKVISHSFYQGTASNLDSAAAVMGELIHHLVEQRPSLLVHVREKYELSGKTLSNDLNSRQGLCEVLQIILRHPSMTDTILIIDDVDERTTEVEELFELIASLSLQSSSKWILSSRSGMSVTRQLNLWKRGNLAEIDLNLAQDQISQAVGVYARYKAESLAVRKHYEDSVRSDIYAYLVFNAGGDFLWISIVCRELENAPPGDILKFLSSLPAGLSSLYDLLHFATRHSRDGELCQEVLATVAVVHRPQTVAELKILVRPFEYYHRDDGFKFFITSNCGSFLKIRGDTVDFIDRSARDYICSKIPPADVALQHEHVFNRSLVSLSGVLHRDMYDLGTAGQRYSYIHRPTPNPLAPVRYAAMYWIHHFAAHSRLVEGGGANTHANLISVLTFLRTFGLFWLEAQILIQGDIDIPGMESFIDSFDAEEWTLLKDLRDLTQDLIRLSIDFSPAFQASPMQLAGDKRFVL